MDCLCRHPDMPVKRIRLHDLRHSFAAQLAAAGISLYQIQTLMGHSDPKTTQRYAHLSPTTLSAEMQVLDHGGQVLVQESGTTLARLPENRHGKSAKTKF